MRRGNTSGGELTAWMHVPSQPLTRSPISQFQTPVSRQNSTLRGALRISNMPDHKIASLASGWEFWRGTGEERSYEPEDVLRVELTLPESFARHPLFAGT
jgi:hypothetical protein